MREREREEKKKEEKDGEGEEQRKRKRGRACAGTQPELGSCAKPQEARAHGASIAW